MSSHNTIPVTNPKLSSTTPTWAPFPGFSLLFDNPGASLRRSESGFPKLYTPVSSDPGLEFYQLLDEFVNEELKRSEIMAYGFCPLPPFSYHVTVWDGLNQGNLSEVKHPWYQKVRDFLYRLPDSMLRDDEIINPALFSLLVQKKWMLHFTFKGLFNWENIALVIQIEPGDEDSEDIMQQLVEERWQLSQIYSEKFGAPHPNTYAPHVTIGYFANPDIVRLSPETLARWNDRLKEKLSGKRLSFDTIGLYGFTDMISFYRHRG